MSEQTRPLPEDDRGLEEDFAFPFPIPAASKAADGCPLGLTKREYHAAMAMLGFIQTEQFAIGTEGARNTAHWAVIYADALLEELSQ